MTALTQPAYMPQPFASGSAGPNFGGLNSIPATSNAPLASLADGFPSATMLALAAGGVPPSGKDFNGLFNWITLAQVWEQSGGCYQFNTAQASSIGGYPLGAVLQSVSNPAIEWMSLQAANLLNPDLGAFAITASCATNVLTVTATAQTLAVGQLVRGPGIPPFTQIVAISGTGPWLCTLSTTPGTIGSSAMSAFGWTAVGGHQADYLNATLRTQHQKNQDYLTSSDFPDLATAVTDIGSSVVTLIINSAISWSTGADLTIPANIAIRVESTGLITVPVGKRLYINGGFSADRLHQCFNASMLTTTITASTMGNILNVSAAGTYPLIAPGWAVSDGGASIPQGAKIMIYNSASGGIGTYQLNVACGTVGSKSMTAWGPSVIFGIGAVEQTYPQWFGAAPDYTITGVGPWTDCGAAIQHAVMSMPWGGKVKIPAGRYQITNSGIVLHPGLTIEGDTAGDNGTGAPPPMRSLQPTYLWNNTASTAIFCLSSYDSQCYIRNLNLGSQSTLLGNTLVTDTTKVGVLFCGHGPGFVYGTVFENVYFYGLYMGVEVVDPWTQNTGDSGGASYYTISGTNYYTYLTGITVSAQNAFAFGNYYQIATVGTTSNWAACASGGVTGSGSVGTVGWIFYAAVASTVVGQVTGGAPTTLTLASVSSGTVAIGQTLCNANGVPYMNGSTPVTITGGSGLSWTLNLTPGVISAGTTMQTGATLPNGTFSLNVVANYYEWGLNPTTFRNCRFVGNYYGVIINANQTDATRFEDCSFSVPTNGDGISLRRCGFVKLDNCFASSFGTLANFVHVWATGGSGALSNCNIDFDNCQAETMNNFLYYATGDGYTNPCFTVRNSIWQMGACITLSAPCELITQGNSVQAPIYVTANGIRYHSYNDHFVWQNYVSGATWGPSSAGSPGADPQFVWTMVPGKYPSSSYPNPITNGVPDMAASIPTTSLPGYTFSIGQRVWSNIVTATTTPGWVCTTAGTTGTISGITGGITSGQQALTCNSVTGLYVGSMISVAGAGLPAGTIITAINGLVCTLSNSAVSTVSGAAVSLTAAVFTAMPIL